MDKKKKVAIIGTNGIPARYGGFETLAHYLTNELSNDFDFTVYCSKIYKKSDRTKSFNNSKLVYIPLKANGFQSILYDIVTSFHAWFNSDILLVLGPAVGFIYPLNFFFKKKLIINHGGLNEWEREKLNFLQKKYAYWSHRIAAQNANINVADNLPLAQSIKETFKVDASIIEYGGDHIQKIPLTVKDIEKYPFLKTPYDLSVSRAQPDNNLHLLLETYREIPNRNLVLISNWKVSEYGIGLKKEYQNKYPNIHIIDAVYNQTDLNVIRSNTSLYIHSHSQCGTAPSLVEAMNYEIPVICFDVPTNRATTHNSSLYFRNNEDLKELLNVLDTDKLSMLKTVLFKIAKENYTWENIATKYAKIFLSA